MFASELKLPGFSEALDRLALRGPSGPADGAILQGSWNPDYSWDG